MLGQKWWAGLGEACGGGRILKRSPPSSPFLLLFFTFSPNLSPYLCSCPVP
jgi:hypothetical protein